MFRHIRMQISPSAAFAFFVVVVVFASVTTVGWLWRAEAAKRGGSSVRPQQIQIPVVRRKVKKQKSAGLMRYVSQFSVQAPRSDEGDFTDDHFSP